MTMKRSIGKHVLLYNLYRLVVLTSLLVSAFIIQLSSPDSEPNLPFYYLIFGSYGFSALIFGVYAFGRGLVAQAYVQVVFDLLLITAFVYISGGIASSMYFLYLFADHRRRPGHLGAGRLTWRRHSRPSCSASWSMASTSGSSPASGPSTPSDWPSAPCS